MSLGEKSLLTFGSYVLPSPFLIPRDDFADDLMIYRDLDITDMVKGMQKFYTNLFLEYANMFRNKGEHLLLSPGTRLLFCKLSPLAR